MSIARGRRLFESTRGAKTPAAPDELDRSLRRRAEAGDLDAQARLAYREAQRADDAETTTPPTPTRTTPRGTRLERT